uniref:Uncharacterized protein n=1 Tax=Rhizophora mucronata TaxID=61149 RepID=A0A2P2IU49_RHIMU
MRHFPTNVVIVLMSCLVLVNQNQYNETHSN